MDWIYDLWSPIVILGAAFIIGWGAETAQTFIPRAVALSILAWLQTLPEFAVEAGYAWRQDEHMMIANLTGSLRLLVGLGWPMIFFVHFFYQGARKKKFIKEITLDRSDSLGVLFLFISILYFVFILFKGSLSCWDSIVLTLIYVVYLVIAMKFPSEEEESEDELPWIGKKIVHLSPGPKVTATVGLFVIGGIGLWYAVHPFIDTMGKWAALLGIEAFVFAQWVAPFLSEFPEKVSAFNWARQPNKVGLAMMNMVNSNINQWTMLAAMIPLVFNISLGFFKPLVFDELHFHELALTIVQSALGGMLLLDLRFSILEALAIFILWAVQLVVPHVREEITWIYLAWVGFELIKYIVRYMKDGTVPAAWSALRQLRPPKSA